MRLYIDCDELVIKLRNKYYSIDIDTGIYGGLYCWNNSSLDSIRL